MDQWKVEEANKQFQAAYHIRLTNKEEKNPFAAIYVFHNRHGMRHGRPLPRQSRCGAEDLQIGRRRNRDRPWRRPGTSTARQGNRADIRALRERLGNSLERWADCELYSGAASDGKVNLLPGSRILRPGPQGHARMERCGGDGLQAGDGSCPERQEPGCPGSPRWAGCRQTAGAGGEQGKGHAREAGGRGRARREKCSARRRPQTAPQFSRSVQTQSGLPRFQPPGDHGIATLRRRTAVGFGLGERTRNRPPGT